MTVTLLDLNNAKIRGLACAALVPALRSILFIDATPAQLLSTAHIVQALIGTVDGVTPHIIHIDATATEDVLWGHLAPTTDTGFHFRIGLLGKGEPRIAIVPDLAHQSLATARAVTVSAGAPAVHMERHGQKHQWPSKVIWIAGCQRDSFGKISPHLLDRFALRISSVPDTLISQTEELLEWISRMHPSENLDNIELRESVQHQMRAAAARHLKTSYESMRLVGKYFPEQIGSLRRELTLAHLALAEAKLDLEATEVEEKHVEAAALLIGLSKPILRATLIDNGSSSESSRAGQDLSQKEAGITARTYQADSTDGESSVSDQMAARDSSNIAQDSDHIKLPKDPYPEDRSSIDREATPLKLPTRRFRPSTAERGSIIGIQPTNKLHDLAIVATIFEATKYQKLRWKYNPDKAGHFIISASDLRRYHRRFLPEQLLVLVVDYTCLQDCEWIDAIVEQLQWAYQRRATVCLIQVGAKSATDELRAERILVRSAITPKLGDALSSGVGRASPLAHGLTLAHETILHATQHGRAPVQFVRLVILSDGRGNIPLSASLEGEICLPVGREGIEDALTVCHSIREIKHTEKIVLDPQPPQYAELPILLADSLNGVLHTVPQKLEAQ